ncbi:MAG: hypothetical protein VKJ87_07415 [Synechococcus sp.]|nr:hypothetical protein [Synechococcus sp.]
MGRMFWRQRRAIGGCLALQGLLLVLISSVARHVPGRAPQAEGFTAAQPAWLQR